MATKIPIATAAYLEHKDEPIVKAYMELYRSAPQTLIPKIWVEFILSTEEGDSIALILYQLPTWDLYEDEVDISLRGKALLDSLLSTREAGLFASVLSAMNDSDRPSVTWAEALQTVLVNRQLIPAPHRALSTQRGHLRMQVALTYTERGTCSYVIERKVRHIPLTIPPEWILKNCKPSLLDATVLQRFRTSFSRLFSEDNTEKKGLELKELVKTRLGNQTDSLMHGKDGQLPVDGLFPLTVRYIPELGGSSSTVALSNIKATPLDSDIAVDIQRPSVSAPIEENGTRGRSSWTFPTVSGSGPTSYAFSKQIRLNEVLHPNLAAPSRAEAAAKLAVEYLRDVWHQLDAANKHHETLEKLKAEKLKAEKLKAEKPKE